MLCVPHSPAHLPWMVDEYTPTPGQITFIITQIPVDFDSIELFVNGVEYEKDTHYTQSGLNVTWLDSFVLKPADKVTIRYQ